MSQTDATEALARGPFYLERTEDVSGTSGTGRVAQGFVFDDGTVALRWLTEHTSTAIYASLSEVEMIHGHDGKTAVVAIEQAAEAADREAAGADEQAGESPASSAHPWYAPLSVWPLRCDDCGAPFNLEHYSPGEHRLEGSPSAAADLDVECPWCGCNHPRWAAARGGA